MQTTYRAEPLRGYAGQLIDSDNPKTIKSKALETATAVPGVVVSLGTTPEQVVVGGDGTAFGILVRSLAHEMNAAGELEYVATDAVDVLTDGDLLVEIQNTGSAGDPIKYADATGLISAGVAGAGETQLKGVLEEDVASNGDLAIISIVKNHGHVALIA